jgi:DNA gyrase subunit A
MGRGSAGVKGIDIEDNEFVVGAELVEEDEEVLVVTEKGYGKKTPIKEYRLTHRGSKGVKTLNLTEKNGNLISLRTIVGEKDLIIVTNMGMTIRIDINQISSLGRNTQGVRLINLKDNQSVSSISLIDKKEEETEEVVETSENLTETVENSENETDINLNN